MASFVLRFVSQADMHKMYYYLIISGPLHIPFHRKKYGYGGYHEIQNIEHFLVYLDSPWHMCVLRSHICSGIRPLHAYECSVYQVLSPGDHSVCVIFGCVSTSSSNVTWRDVHIRPVVTEEWHPGVVSWVRVYVLRTISRSRYNWAVGRGASGERHV